MITFRLGRIGEEEKKAEREKVRRGQSRGESR